MAGATRVKTRNAAVKESASPSNDDTIADAPLDKRVEPTAISNGYATPQHNDPFVDSEDVSRLGEDFQPMSMQQEDVAEERESSARADGDSLALGEHMQDCIATINRLEGLGLSKLDIPLPKCVVLGEQSTGKSSVIEGLSEITTPRADDTCTRCPLFIKMEPSNDPRAKWIARVTLRRSFAFDGQESPERQFRGWFSSRETDEIPFAMTESREHLTHLISRAQSATINPRSDPISFLQPMLPVADDDAQSNFSPNIVCIYITAPELPNLSFYDLPGIINQSDSPETQYQINFVRSLVANYISDPDSLILVTCSLDTDIANSTAASLARDLGAENRCIGILTKPDRLPTGSRHEKLRTVLSGNRFALGHGYFVVKNLDQEAINDGLTHRNAREQERHFFDKAPWSTNFRDYKSRFGTCNLQSFLSRKLATNVATKLPIIHAEIDARLRDVESQLELLPKPPQSAVRTITDILQQFSEDVKKQMEAGHGCTTWSNTWDKRRQTFYDNMLVMKPVMMRTGERDKGISVKLLPGASSLNCIPLLSGDEEDGDGDVGMANPVTPTKKRKLEDGSPVPTPTKTPKKTHRQGASQILASGSTPASVHPINFKDLRTVFQLDELARRVAQESKSNFNILRPELLDEISIASLKKWHLPMKEFFVKFEQELKSQIRAMFHERFHKWDTAALYKTAWELVDNMLDNHFQQQREVMAEESLNDELDKPYIFPEDIFEQDRLTMIRYYVEARFDARLELYAKEAAKHMDRPLTQQELNKVTKDKAKSVILSEEPYKREIDIVAYVSTYYVTAMRRFHAAICIRIQSKFFHALKEDLRNELDSGLGIHDDDKGSRNAKRLLEDTRREKKRQDLIANRDALLAGQQILNELQQKYSDGPSSQTSSLDETPLAPASSSFGTPTLLSEAVEDVAKNGPPHC